VPRVASVAAYEQAFATRGYARCASELLEVGVEKIALFVNGHGVPTHAARQLPDGSWTSKLGFEEDIRHDLRQLEGAAYGTVTLFMARARIAPLCAGAGRKLIQSAGRKLIHPAG
jgi:hypothetical protein